MCDRDRTCRNPKCPCNEPEPCEACKEKAAIIADLRDELNASSAVSRSLGIILKATANTLKGKPEPWHQHPWHDLPEVAENLKRERDEWRDRIHSIVHNPDMSGDSLAARIRREGYMAGLRAARSAVESLTGFAMGDATAVIQSDAANAIAALMPKESTDADA